MWERVLGGLLPPSFFRGTPMLCIGYGDAKAGEGFLSADTEPSFVADFA